MKNRRVAILLVLLALGAAFAATQAQPTLEESWVIPLTISICLLTAVAVRRGDRLWERLVDTEVKVKAMSNAEVNAYLASGEWQGKAGAYGIQGRFGAMIPWLKGSFTGVVGLPVAETAHLLQAAGIDLHGPWGTA